MQKALSKSLAFGHKPGQQMARLCPNAQLRSSPGSVNQSDARPVARVLLQFTVVLSEFGCSVLDVLAKNDPDIVLMVDAKLVSICPKSRSSPSVSMTANKKTYQRHVVSPANSSIIRN